jgi:hypothetical protein
MEVAEPLKVAEDRDDFTVAMKLEVYPNRDSLSFMERWNMTDCETFIRGTIRFKGFSHIISAFHDVGLTSDDPVPSGVTTLRDLAESKLGDADLKKVHPCFDEALKQVMMGVPEDAAVFTKKILSKADISFLTSEKAVLDNYKGIIKTMRFLGFYDDPTKLV